MARFKLTKKDDDFTGGNEDDRIRGQNGDDLISGGKGDDSIFGDAGFDTLFGDAGNDRLFGGAQNDNLQGNRGNDFLSGDNGNKTARGEDLGSDNLDGGAGDDFLLQGDGNDRLSGDAGSDTFAFRFQDPMVALAAGTGRAFSSITDFNPDDDRFTFDAAGVGKDANGANFLDGGREDGDPGGRASSFFKGDAEDSNGESVMILTDQGFATGQDAVNAAQNEETGDLIIYFNTTVGVASLLFVDGPDQAHSIARLTNIESVDELQNTDFTAKDFIFV